MENEKTEGSAQKACPGATSAAPSLNLMEQLLLAKMEKHGLADGARKKTMLLRTNSLDSQNSARSDQTNDSTNSCYCKCDDCLLGIVDKHQTAPPTRSHSRKVNLTRRLLL